MDTIATIYYWVRVGLVVFVGLLAVVFAFRRSRAKAAKRDLIVGIVGVIFLVLAVVVAQPPLNYLVAAAALVVGMIVGFGLGGVRPLVAWLAALLIVFSAIMSMFGEGGAVAAGLTGLTFAVGMPLGQGFRPKKRPAEAAPVLVPAPIAAPVPAPEAPTLEQPPTV